MIVIMLGLDQGDATPALSRQALASALPGIPTAVMVLCTIRKQRIKEYAETNQVIEYVRVRVRLEDGR